ncbi:hypothetical protein AB0C87_24820 [Actinomadura sp. NPDC048021]|uniref:hypothetical protein n=1 Tax=Actinomadura sp. NPDC048021 TaxID=3155385 RepID=UPI0033F687CA
MFRELTDHELYVLEDTLYEGRLKAAGNLPLAVSDQLNVWQDVFEAWEAVDAEMARRRLAE